MSPTLLELVIVVFLFWAAWQIGVVVTPWLLSRIISFWRLPKPPSSSGPDRFEKNVTPPSEPGSVPRKPNGFSSK